MFTGREISEQRGLGPLPSKLTAVRRIVEDAYKVAKSLVKISQTIEYYCEETA